jgi:pyruvate formate lyase activating enzyme
MQISKKLFRKLEGESLECIACRRNCIIPRGFAGYCGVRENEKGELNLLVYGKLSSVCVDPVEKKPLFHFLPGTNVFSIGTLGCNFSCAFCQNWDISQVPNNLRQANIGKWRSQLKTLVDACHNLRPLDAVNCALDSGCKSIAFTYNEPTIFAEYAIDVMKEAGKSTRGRKLKGVFVTNGFETRECWRALKGLVSAANIDLKAFSKGFYKELCGASIDGVMDSIEYARKLGFWVEVTTLLIPGKNDSLKELKEGAEWLCSIDSEMPWHVTAFHPDYRMHEKSTPNETLLKAREIGLKAGLKHVYCGNAWLPDCEKTFCPGCGASLIEREGFAVTKNELVSGKCPECGFAVKGIWE